MGRRQLLLIMASTLHQEFACGTEAAKPSQYLLEALERLSTNQADDFEEAEAKQNDTYDSNDNYDDALKGQETLDDESKVSCEDYEFREVDGLPETPVTTASSVLSRGRKSQVSIDDREVANPNGDAWKEFDHDSEAGRMLRKLYAGARHNAPLASYPQLKTRSRQLKPESWFTGKLGIDPRKETERRKREQSVDVPRPLREEIKPVPAIYFVPKRKPHERIEEEQRRIAEERAIERPLPRKAISTETEKRRLAMQFQFKGGKALPESGTIEPIQGNIPLSLISGKPSKAQLRRSQQSRSQTLAAARVQQRQRLEEDFDQVHREVQALKYQMENLDGSHGAAKQIANIRAEIHQRLGELEAIDTLLHAPQDLM